MSRPLTCDVVVVGAGIVGAACALYAARAGLDVVVVDRGPVAGGTTGAGEGNLLVSDKEPGPELDLALLSLRAVGRAARTARRRRPSSTSARAAWWSPPTPAALAALRAPGRGAAGAPASTREPSAAARLRELEPHLAPGPRRRRALPAGRAGAADARRRPPAAGRRAPARRCAPATPSPACCAPGGGSPGCAPRAATIGGRRGGQRRRHLGRARSPRWPASTCRCCPRRGFILVTEPLPPLIRHKVYSADYVANVAATRPACETSPVVEGTRAGTVLIGASRERVGFDRAHARCRSCARLAAQAVAAVPGARPTSRCCASTGASGPYCPDHLPVVGADPRAPGCCTRAATRARASGSPPATGAADRAACSTGRPTDARRWRRSAPERFAEVASREPA